MYFFGLKERFRISNSVSVGFKCKKYMEIKKWPINHTKSLVEKFAIFYFTFSASKPTFKHQMLIFYDIDLKINKVLNL
jgi:hypothetical protein